MTVREQLLSHLRVLLVTYCRHQGVMPSTATARLLGDPRLAARPEAGDDFRVSTYDKVLDAFARRWPDGLEWPASVPTPDTRRA
jgi:hypothetical protein